MERPILFSGEMVRAILDGRKTQTRRVVKSFEAAFSGKIFDCVKDFDGSPSRLDLAPDNWEVCPYGLPGDRLWLRETWAAGAWDSPTEITCKPSEIVKKEAAIYYRAAEFPQEKFKWRPSIFMPRWASRIDLEITGVRVERLQNISEEDARAEGAPDYEEGIDAPPPDDGDYRWSYAASFRDLWKRINGPESWDENPFVWVIEFTRVRP